MRRWNCAALGAAVLLLAGCEGENRFTGPGTVEPEGPVVDAVIVPESVEAGTILEVEIRASSSEGITAVDVTLIEDAIRERTLTVDPPDTDLTVFTEFQLPQTLARETVEVQVEVQDRLGARSETFAVEIPVTPADQGL